LNRNGNQQDPELPYFFPETGKNIMAECAKTTIVYENRMGTIWGVRHIDELQVSEKYWRSIGRDKEKGLFPLTRNNPFPNN
jgi:hypothetical protein